MYDNNYEEYMNAVLGCNICSNNTYYNLSQKYPKVYKELKQKIRLIDDYECINKLEENAEKIYKELKIAENNNEIKKTIVEIIEILIIHEKIIENQNRNITFNRGKTQFNPYVDF